MKHQDWLKLNRHFILILFRLQFKSEENAMCFYSNYYIFPAWLYFDMLLNNAYIWLPFDFIVNAWFNPIKIISN